MDMNSKKNIANKIGVFDSGLGGLTVLEAIQNALPGRAILYFGDHAHAPYGDKSAEQVHDFTRKSVRWLFDQGCDLVILACNTASAVALHDLQTDWLPLNDEGQNRRVLGVFVPMIEAMTRRDWGDNTPPTHTGLRNVLLFATEATVQSGAFARELKFRARDVEVIPIACPELVPAIEAGDEEAVAKWVKIYVDEGLSHEPHPQTAALACTHYPLALKEFEQNLPKSCEIFSQGDIVAEALRDYLIRHKRFDHQGETVEYVTSGDVERVNREARKIFGRKVNFEKMGAWQAKQVEKL